MVTFIILVFLVAYFFYVQKWASSYLSKEYSFGSPQPPRVLPHSPVISLLIGILWFAILFRATSGLLDHGGDFDFHFVVLAFIALALSYLIFYKLGEMRGVASMKNTHLFRTQLDKNNN